MPVQPAVLSLRASARARALAMVFCDAQGQAGTLEEASIEGHGCAYVRFTAEREQQQFVSLFGDLVTVAASGLSVIRYAMATSLALCCSSPSTVIRRLRCDRRYAAAVG